MTNVTSEHVEIPQLPHPVEPTYLPRPISEEHYPSAEPMFSHDYANDSDVNVPRSENRSSGRTTSISSYHSRQVSPKRQGPVVDPENHPNGTGNEGCCSNCCIM